MPKQESKTTKPQTSAQKRKAEEPESQEAKDLRNKTLSDDVDEMLDEIDGVLEDNAEEFVQAYVQKGGQ